MKPNIINPQPLSPKDAEELLKTEHPEQRKASNAWVKLLAGRITRGEWDPYASVFCVDEAGNLTDGGQRCRAIVAAGITVKAIIVRMPWSKYRDDTRRRSLADRCSVSRRVSAIARIAGRIIGRDDPDDALLYFSDAINLAGIDGIDHSKPWGCAAAGVGCLAAEIKTGAGKDCLARLIKATPDGEMERRLCVMAQRNAIETTGTGQMNTVVSVFSAAIQKKSTLDDVRKALCA